MKALRIALIVYVLIVLVGSTVLVATLHTKWVPAMVVYLLINAGILFVGVVFEKGRYKSVQAGNHADWKLTGERFIDPATGKLVEVKHNSKTGERVYLPITDDESTKE